MKNSSGDCAARTLCYVFANRLLFYESFRTKFDELKELHVPKRPASPHDLYVRFQKAFQLAVDATGDYETLFYPAEKDWAGPHIFGHEHSQGSWRSVLENLRSLNFKAIRTDILGGIFKRLIEPEERHKFGQHYTNEDLVDVVNAFCIRKAEDSWTHDPLMWTHVDNPKLAKSEFAPRFPFRHRRAVGSFSLLTGEKN